MVFRHLVTKKIRSPLTGVVVIRDRPGSIIGELLTDAGGEGGMLDVEQERAAGIECPVDKTVGKKPACPPKDISKALGDLINEYEANAFQKTDK